MFRRTLVPAVVLALAALSCSRSPNPVSPTTDLGGTTGSGGITVVGSIRAAIAAPAVTSASDPMTVTVVGTSISATVGQTGQFTLQGVPPGDVQLKFSGAGANAIVTLSQLQNGQTVTITVTVSGTNAAVEHEERSGGSEQEVEGRIEALASAGPNTLVVAGKTVTIDGQTTIKDGSATRTFADLEVGMRVHVKGTSGAAGIVARIIEIQNSNTGIQVPVNGVIDSLAGTELAYQFKIGSRLIKGDANTTFFGAGNRVVTFADLKNGVRVEVKGEQRDGYIYAVRLHIEGLDDGEEPPEAEDCANGALTAIAGVSPSLTLTVAAKTVRTDASTKVMRRGDSQTLASLQVGQTLEACGVLATDGSIGAKMIKIEDDSMGGMMEIEGNAGNLGGACPAVTFKVNGIAVATDASTVWSGGTCATLRSGSDVEVKGTRQAGGSILATTVKID